MVTSDQKHTTEVPTKALDPAAKGCKHSGQVTGGHMMTLGQKLQEVPSPLGLARGYGLLETVWGSGVRATG